MQRLTCEVIRKKRVRMHQLHQQNGRCYCSSSTLFIILLAALPLLLNIHIPQNAMADECSDNIGFKKNVPDELRQKFPLCDYFLDIVWIDPTGKFNIEYYSNDNSEMKEKKLNITWRIGKLRIDDYNNKKNKMEAIYLLVLEEIQKEGELPWRAASEMIQITKKDYYSREFESFLKGAVFRYSTVRPVFGKVTIEKGNKSRVLNKSFYSDTQYGCLFDKNICMLSSDETTADFYGMRHLLLKHDLNKPRAPVDITGELKVRYDAILNFAQEKCLELGKKERERLKYQLHTVVESDCMNKTADVVRESTVAIDINHDGKAVYFFSIYAVIPKLFVYFLKDGNYEFKEVDDDCGFAYYLNEKTYHFDKCDLTCINKEEK